MSEPWKCPYCNCNSTRDRQNTFISNIQVEGETFYNLGNPCGGLFFEAEVILCRNLKCKKITISCVLSKYDSIGFPEGKPTNVEGIKEWNVLPESNVKNFPNYIPKPIIDDYEQACLIVNLSPKASATLARRCLQTMIRDFWKEKVEPNNLFNEIKQIEDELHPSIFRALNSVRKLGNIGAHNEEDINIIIDIEPPEAKLLIEIVEFLIEDWYIRKYEKEKKLKHITQIEYEKDEIRANNKAVPAKPID